jgi:hypothetical protein
MKPTRTLSKSPVAVARQAYRLGQQALEPYSSIKSRHDFTCGQLFAILVLKTFFKTDYRGIVQYLKDLPDLRQVLELKKVPHYSTLSYAHRRLMDLPNFEHLQAGVFAHAQDQHRVAEAPVGAMDSTGFECRHISQHFIHRKTALHDYAIRNWTKLTTICETKSHLWSAAVVSKGPNYDFPWFLPALDQSQQWLALDTLLADAGFDDEEHHRLARQDHAIRRTFIALNPRWSVYRAAKTSYRRAMQGHFDDGIYRRRWHVESSFSQHKRVLGSALRSRSTETRECECFLRVLTHNLMLLALLYYVFNGAFQMLKK